MEEAIRDIGGNNDVITTAEIHKQIEESNQLMPKVIFNEISTQSCPLLKVTLVITNIIFIEGVQHCILIAKLVKTNRVTALKTAVKKPYTESRKKRNLTYSIP